MIGIFTNTVPSVSSIRFNIFNFSSRGNKMSHAVNHPLGIIQVCFFANDKKEVDSLGNSVTVTSIKALTKHKSIFYSIIVSVKLGLDN